MFSVRTSGTFESDSAGGIWYSAPDLAGDPQDGGTLVAVQPGIEPATAATYSTTNGTMAVLAPQADLGSSPAECSYEHQIAVIPGGQQFIAACGGLSGIYAYNTKTLAAGQPGFSTGIYPGGVAVNTDGTIAVGTYGPQSAAYVYNADGTLLNVFQLGNGNPELVATNGLAWENTTAGHVAVDHHRRDDVQLPLDDPRHGASGRHLRQPHRIDLRAVGRLPRQGPAEDRPGQLQRRADGQLHRPAQHHLQRRVHRRRALRGEDRQP